jgi:hypothetical protein
VTGSEHVLEIGARTSALRSADGRIRRLNVPAPLTVPATGTLQLGFKHFLPGANSGSFEVTVWEVRPTP